MAIWDSSGLPFGSLSPISSFLLCLSIIYIALWVRSTLSYFCSFVSQSWFSPCRVFVFLEERGPVAKLFWPAEFRFSDMIDRLFVSSYLASITGVTFSGDGEFSYQFLSVELSDQCRPSCFPKPALSIVFSG